ncbi:MAG: hypothetical protein ACO1N0_19430 [Fluviicola sp.]
MKSRADVIMVLDSILDDYYFVWECFSEYSQIKQNEKDHAASFSQSLKEAFELEYVDFYEGVDFNGEEVLMTSFVLNDSVIEKLLNWEDDSKVEVRIKTSKKGIAFLDQNR